MNKKISNKDLEKYSRQILIEKIGIDGQIKIFKTKILIIGCGGLGSIAATYLSMAGVRTLGLVDDDKIELSNVSRQLFFTEDDIGKYKTEVLKDKLKKINSNSNVKTFKKKFSQNTSPNILRNYKIILDCTDNFKSKYLINDQCFKYKKILISAALYNFELQLFAFRSWHKNSPCYRCIFPTKILSSQNCADIGILTTVAGMGGLLQANMTLNVILGNSKNIFNFFHIFNSITNENKKITISKNKNCKVCRI